jgi:hypothetical protein
MADAQKIIKELSEIVHEFNNLLNTLNGYTELAQEAKNANNEEEYAFFKDKIFVALGKKLPSAKGLAERLNKVQAQITEFSS